ncbi:MAG: hypothetical protein AAF498_01160 [Pseudomonadota bacterium]
MTDKTAKDLEQNWMTPWEKWALGELFETGEVDMSEVPAEHRGKTDVEKSAVSAALIQPANGDKNAPPESVAEEDWPAWQILSARFIEYVCTDKAFIDARRRNRVHIFSSRITEKIDLGGLHLPGELALDDCRIDARLNLHNTEITGFFSLQTSHCPQGLYAQGLRTTGHVFLRGGASFEGTVNFAGADIGDQFNCSGSSFKSGDGQYAVIAYSLKTGSYVFLSIGASFVGEVDLNSADIGAGLQLWGSSFESEINFASAVIENDMLMDETKLGMPAPNWGDGASLNLQNARIGALQGSFEAWTRQSDGNLVPRNLDGLTFTRLAGGAGGTSLDQASTKDLRRWLSENVTHNRDGENAFTPSPYLAMASALKATGEDDKARNILIALEKRRTRAMRFGSWSGMQKLFRILWLGPMTGYGYASGRGAFILAGMIIFFAVLGLNAELHKVSSLNSNDITWAEHWRAWLGFSFEMALPLADLDPVNDTFLEDRFTADSEYTSLPSGLRALFMTERFLGLAILATLIAGLTGWAERRGES